MKRLIAGASGLLLAGGVACSSPSSDENGANSESKYGHIVDLDPDAPQFLINKKQGEKYRVCLARYMVDMYPGIQGEIRVAINIWGNYLGRTIPVDIVEKDLPRATAAQSPGKLAQDYLEACGQGFDVVVGLARLDGGTLGITTTSTTSSVNASGKRVVREFARGLFLRDFDLTPYDADGEKAEWASLEASSGKARTEDALLAEMKERTNTHYVEDGRGLTVPTLTHEFGHVWGMCDQYEGTTNCDAKNSTSHLVTTSIMGAKGGKEPLFLTDDDIEGIRALARRPGYAHGWSAEALKDSPRAIQKKDVEFLRISRVKTENGAVGITFGIVTTVPAKFGFQLRTIGASEWTDLTSSFEGAQGIDEPRRRMSVNVDGAHGKWEAKVRLSLRGPDGKYGEPIEVVKSEE